MIYTIWILNKISDLISASPNLLRISGFTDKSNASPIASYGNCELSADRANATRKYLMIQGISPDGSVATVERWKKVW